MNIFVDCEFNDFGGDLISMGLVDQNGEHWYGVLKCENPTKWVSKNVMPVLNQGCEPVQVFRLRLQNFLNAYETCHIIADWPEDIAWFCRMLITGPGQRIATPPLTFEIDRRLDSKNSAVPHNALHDAYAIRKYWANLVKP